MSRNFFLELGSAFAFCLHDIPSAIAEVAVYLNPTFPSIGIANSAPVLSLIWIYQSINLLELAFLYLSVVFINFKCVQSFSQSLLCPVIYPTFT